MRQDQTRDARHGAWVSKKRSRSRSGPQLLPTVAGLTVAGFMATGAAAAMHLSPALASEDPSLALGVNSYHTPSVPTGTSTGTSSSGASSSTGSSTPSGTVYASASVLGLPGAIAVDSGADSTVADAWLSTKLPVDSASARSSFLPQGSQVLITNPDTGRSTVVQITGWSSERLELSRAAIEDIAPGGSTKYIATVQFQVLPEGSFADAT